MTDLSPNTERLAIDILRQNIADIEALELTRRSRKRIVMVYAIIGLIAFGLLWFFVLRHQEIQDVAGKIVLHVFVLALCVLPATKVWQDFDRRFRLESKPMLLGALAKTMGLRHMPGTSVFPIGILDRHRIIPRGHIAHESEDGFTGPWKGAQVTFAEMKLYYPDTSKNAKTLRSFVTNRAENNDLLDRKVKETRGLAIRIMLPAEVRGHTAIIARGIERFIGLDLSRLSFSGYTGISFPSIRFQDHYTGWTTDPLQAHEIFHPVFLEHFLKLPEHLGTDRFSISLMDKELAIWIATTKDAFEPATLSAPIDERSIARAFTDIQKINVLQDLITHLPADLTRTADL